MTTTLKIQINDIIREVYGHGNAYINGIKATQEDLTEFERQLRAGLVRAKGRVVGQNVYYQTITE